MKFATLLQDAIHEKGIKAADVAKYTCRSVSSVRKWISGAQVPNDIILRQLGTYLKDDYEYFLRKGITYPNGTSRF